MNQRSRRSNNNFTPFTRFTLFTLLTTFTLFTPFTLFTSTASAQGTRLLRQPTISDTHIAFIYGADLWITDLDGGDARRLTSTPAVESDPHFSPDGQLIAFSSNRSGTTAVYTVSVDGGQPTQLTWFPANAFVRGWTPDGEKILYATGRATAPAYYHRLWTVSKAGGPSTMLPAPWANDGAYSPDGNSMIIDRMRRWDTEWRAYRGGQNTPLVLMNLESLEETHLPNERTVDIHPVWVDDAIYFLSDRDWTMNIWRYDPASGAISQLTDFSGNDIKWLDGRSGLLVYEKDGYLHTLNLVNNQPKQLEITVRGDFPWAATQWEDVSKKISDANLSPSGKRAIVEARGEIFTIPVENGDVRNLTRSSDAADRAPVWSPDGAQVAWFSDEDGQYALKLTNQDGLSEVRTISIGESKMAWTPTWSPDGSRIAFVDDDVRVRVIEVESGNISTVDEGGINIERSQMGLTWSPDSKWLAYAKTGSNNFRRIVVWSVDNGEVQYMTDRLANSFAPAWDRDGRHLYFLASTDLALGSGWANTSAMGADPEYGAYVVVLRKDDPSPFLPKSDEEPVKDEEEENKDNDESDKKDDKKEKATPKDEEKGKEANGEQEKTDTVRIDWEGLARRTIALPIPVRNYNTILSGPKGVIFIGERIPQKPGVTLQKFTLKEKEAKEYATGVSQAYVSADGKKMLIQSNGKWQVVDTGGSDTKGGKGLKTKLEMKLNRKQEWRQMFEEAWRYERDYFYDPNIHGRDWNDVKARYEPLIEYVQHRSDLTYILDQVNGELSVGHSFVFGGDLPDVEDPKVGCLGADLEAANGYWRIQRIYTSESWNPKLKAPLDRPNMKIEEGHYIVGIDANDLTAEDDPYRLLDGTLDRQTVLWINDQPSKEGAWKEIVEPIKSERSLRQRAWVEDNRRRVDSLSNGKLAYVWVPNTGGAGVVSFNRYYFAQQDKLGAVIDERFNGGGLLDDYMVDLMTRRLRAAITNETPNGQPFRLPAGILGPKVLLINELAGSGGDFFPWVFRQQQAGPLIGKRTWGGLVKSSVHYALVDGGALTAPDNAVFDPINKKWIGENEGIPPDIEVQIDAKSAAEGRDVQLERAVEEALKLLEKERMPEVVPPAFSKPAAQSGKED